MPDLFPSSDICLGGVVKTCSWVTRVLATVRGVRTCGELVLGFSRKQTYS